MARPRRGTTSEELFLQTTAQTPTSVTIQPLRIQKQRTPSPPQDNPLPYPTGGPSRAQGTGSGGPGSGPRTQNNLPYPDNRPSAGQQRKNSLPQFGHQYGQESQENRLPYPDNPKPPTTSSSPGPGRHVSVTHSDTYPTPPPFKHREGTRPQRLVKTNTTPQLVPESPGPEPPPKDEPPSPTAPELNPYPEYHQQYWPPLGRNRPGSTLSTSTTAARRGSPPPPETPATATVDVPPLRVGESASVPSASSRLPQFQSQQSQQYQKQSQHPKTQTSFPPQQSQGQNPFHQVQSPLQPVAYQQPQANQTPEPVRRPWTPTEDPGSHPHGPLTVYQGAGIQEPTNPQPYPQAQPQPQYPQYQQQQQQLQQQQQQPPHVQALEQDMQRMNMNSSPPPSYASLSQLGAAQLSAQQAAASSNATTAQGYPNEKHTVVLGAAAPEENPHHRNHPAFHNENAQQQQPQQIPQAQQPLQQTQQPPPQQQQQAQQPPIGFTQPQPQPQPQQLLQAEPMQPQFSQQPAHFTPPPGVGPSAPPPLPEGWMAHLDPASGQYYYIHIATQRTQWEFPVPETISPPLQSPGFAPPLGSPGIPPMNTYADPMTTMNAPPMLHHTGSFPMAPPPPQLPLAGIAMYNVAPSNGEYFGPYLRYTNMDIEHGIWLGSIMLVTADPNPPTMHLHQSLDLSPNPRQLKANPIYTHRAWTFYRYDIDIQMTDLPAKWTYAITSVMGCIRYEFLVAGRTERNWRFIAHSCNDFSVNVSSAERARIGGPDYMWKDVLVKHAETGGFHVQLGGGDQIYADRIWKELPLLKEWLHIKGKENRKTAPWTAAHEDDVQHAYFHYYTSHFDQPNLREAWAQIPHMLQIDDHDIFDGFGSYPEYMQFSNMFKNIGRIAVHWYLLFQHHTTLDILRVTPDERDLFTITGTGWHFIKYLGPAIAVVGVDTRAERNPHQVLAGPTYQGLFPRIANLPASIQHIVIMLSVPIIYPRLDMAEQVVNTMATSKKAVTGTFNLVGKVVGSAAGVVGAKQVVGEGFNSVKKAFGKSGLMSSVVSIFGEVDLLDDLRDHWTHESKDLERTYLIRTLQGIAHQRSMRVTFLSGDVHCCGAGLVHDPSRPQDHKTMYQIITSAIVNVPPPNVVLKVLHNNKILYIPQNGMRSTHTPSDTKEDMMEIFQADVTGQVRELKKLMGRRNYAIFVGFDSQPPAQFDTMKALPLSLAVDFIVQGEGPYGPTVKYGPVVIPRVEYGH